MALGSCMVEWSEPGGVLHVHLASWEGGGGERGGREGERGGVREREGGREGGGGVVVLCHHIIMCRLCQRKLVSRKAEIWQQSI